MKVTVIVIGYNSWHYLQKNLASLEFLSGNQEAVILYVDNASTDETRSAVTHSYPNVKMISCGVNRGVSAARNIGMVNTVSDYLWFLDSDTEVNEEAFHAMLNYMETHEDVGICSCRLIGGDGETQASCKHFPTKWGVVKSGIHNMMKHFGWTVFPNAYNETVYKVEGTEPMDVDFVIGACMLVRRKAQNKVGFFDERIFFGPEDADYCRRMRKKDYKVICLPDVSIIHNYQRTITKKFFSRQTLRQINGLRYYFAKVMREKIQEHKEDRRK